MINPRRACAARVTVVGFVILSVKLDLTSGMSNRAISERAYSVAYERQTICGDFPEATAFKRNTSEKANMLINRLTRGQLSPFDTQRSARGYPTSVNNIQPCPERWLLMTLARVGARTAATKRTATTRGHGQFPRTRIGLVGKNAVCMHRGFAL